MAFTSCDEIFKAMPNGFDPEAAGDWESIVNYKITGDDGGEWVVEVKDGSCSIEEGSNDTPSATLEASAETWIGIQNGDVNPTMAFMSGKVKISGKMGDITKTQSVFRKKKS